MLLSAFLTVAAMEPAPDPLPRGVQLELAGGIVGGFGLVATGLGVLPRMVPDNKYPIGTSMVGLGGLMVSGLAPVLSWRAREAMGPRPPGWMSAAALGTYVVGVGAGLTGTGLGWADRPVGPWLQVSGVTLLTASTAILLVQTERLRFAAEEAGDSLSMRPAYRPSIQLSPWLARSDAKAQPLLGLGLSGVF